MTDRILPEHELAFLLYDWLKLDTLARTPRHAGQGRDVWDPVLETARRIAVDHFHPHNRKADAEEPRIEDGHVRLVPEARAALDAFVDAGFMGLAFDEVDGGLQQPWTVTQAAFAFFKGTNVGTAAYPFLTTAAANLLKAVASPAQQARWMAPLVAGRWFGTMCLSEPHAGSSLADIRTRATPLGDGRYRLKGNKMWISGGEHELTPNIVHMVLARVEGAPAGTKGISLFIVPRFRLDEAGNPGPANGVKLIGLNHKLGYRGTVNTALSFGEEAECIGEIVGAEGDGLRGMFHMMNEARLGVGMGAAALAYAGYGVSRRYARERPQGRPVGAKDPAAPQVPIIQHADVKRMLMQQKVYAEGAMALGLYCARLIDDLRTLPPGHPETEREKARLTALLDILTPIMKAWASHYGLIANDLAIQIHGGYGYTRDFEVEQIWRDNRLNPIHEGTNGIQSLDLLGRKAMQDGGAPLRHLAAAIEFTVQDSGISPALRHCGEALARTLMTASQVTMTLAERGRKEGADAMLGDSWTYMEMLGHIVVGWIWLSQARAAERARKGGTGDPAHLDGKVAACRWFFATEMPKVTLWSDRLQAGNGRADMLDEAHL